MDSFGLSQRRACSLVAVSRTVFQYKPRASELNGRLCERLRELASVHRRWGAWKMHRVLQREGWPVNHKRVERLYRAEGLSLRIRRRKKLKAIGRVEMPATTRVNERWSMDFVHDKLWAGRRFRSLTIVDQFSRECLALEVDTSLGGERVKAVLERLAERRGMPGAITVDNGPEFISRVVDEWAYRGGVKLAFSRPGKPTDNAYIESFNGKFRDECLDVHYFSTLAEARRIIEDWRVEYNSVRPHRSLDGLSPEQFLEQKTGSANLQTA